MAIDAYLAERLAMSLNRRHVAFTAKKMMGGLVFMVDDKMFIAISRDKYTNLDQLLVRVGEFAQDLCIERTGCSAMEFAGRPMTGFVNVDPEGFDLEEDWEFWVEKALEYNPLAKRSKK